MENILPRQNGITGLIEVLLVASESSEPYSIRILDPVSGSSQWSLKGSELQGAVAGPVEFIGSENEYLAVATADRSLLHMIKTGSSKHDSVKYSLPSPLKCIAAHPSGNFMYGAIGGRLHTWTLDTGELLSVEEGHLGEITVVKVSKCGDFVATGFEHGGVDFYISSELMKESRQINGRQFHSYTPHSSAVEDLHIAMGPNPRVLTVSTDHTMILYSPGSKQALLKISTDEPLTACCMCSTESRIFLGTRSGKICVLDFHSQAILSMRTISTTGKEGNVRENGVAFYAQHTSAVSRLEINNDGSRLASGDQKGAYCIWDISNGQCLRTGSMKGRITQLSFILNWASLEGNQCQRRIAALKSTVDDRKTTLMLTKRSQLTNTEHDSSLDAHLDSELRKLVAQMEGEETSPCGKRPKTGGKSTSSEQKSSMIRNGSQPDPSSTIVKELEEEVAKLKSANKELFDYALQLSNGSSSSAARPE